MQNKKLVPPKRPCWHELSKLFADEKACLASFLALETAELIEGVKPANLLNIANRKQACGRNLYLLWKRFGTELLEQSGLEVREIIDRGRGVLLFIHHRSSLQRLLLRPNMKAFLVKAGHDNPSALDEILDALQERIQRDNFPHEIGALLGYPLKDVAGFMGWAELPGTAQGPWKIFGAPEKSLRLAEEFLNCRCRMAQRLSGAVNPVECLKIACAA
jgi:hypothetical protein